MAEKMSKDDYIRINVSELIRRGNEQGYTKADMAKVIGKSKSYFNTGRRSAMHREAMNRHDAKTLCYLLGLRIEDFLLQPIDVYTDAEQNERIKVDIPNLLSVARRKGYSNTRLADIIDRSSSYFCSDGLYIGGKMHKGEYEKVCRVIGEDPNRFLVSELSNYPIEIRTEPKEEDMGTAINKKEFMKMLTARWGDPLVADDCWQHYEKRNWKKANGKPVKSIKDCAYGFEYYNENLAAAAVKNGFELGNGNPFAEELYAKRDAEKAKDDKWNDFAEKFVKRTNETINKEIERKVKGAYDELYKGLGDKINETIERLTKLMKKFGVYIDEELQKRDTEIERLNSELSDLRGRLAKAEIAVESLEDHYKSSQNTLAKQIQHKANQLRTAVVWKPNAVKRSAKG